MPWPWALIEWLIDHTASAMSGRPVFRLPYPKKDWRRERRWNRDLLATMHHVWRANEVFSKEPEKWDKADREFYKAMLKGLKTEGLKEQDSAGVAV
jgi:hypothetical protein